MGRRISPAALSVGALAALSASAAFGHQAVAGCAGAQLGGRFAVVAGSAGAGNISYELRLKNVSTTTCVVSGLPSGTLLGRLKRPLPTHVRAAHPGALTAVLVTLAPGDTTFVTARFSPDVPGTGEQMIGACEPTAYWLRVRPPGGGTTSVKLVPPTPVCEHGRMFLSAYGRRG